MFAVSLLTWCADRGRRARTATIAAGFGLGIGLVAVPVYPQAGPAPPTYKVGLLEGFAPLEVWPTPESAPGGVDVELLRALEPALHARLEFQRYTDYAQLERDLTQGRIHIATSMARSTERESRMLFTRPYLTVPQAVVTRSEETSTTIQADLSGRRIAVVPGFVHERIANERFPQAYRIPVKNLDDALRSVKDGRTDLLIEAEPVVRDLLERRRLRGLQVIRTFTFPEGQLRFAVTNKDRDLLKALDAAVGGLQAGTADRLLATWQARPLVTEAPVEGASKSLATLPAAPIAPLKIGFPARLRPFTFTDDDGEAQGIGVALARSALARLNLPIESVHEMPLPELLAGLKSGQVDMALGLTETAERRAFMTFVGPYYSDPMVLIARPSKGIWSLPQIAERRLAIPSGHFLAPLLAANYPSATQVPCTHIAACLDAVEKDEADATLGGMLASVQLLAQRRGTTLEVTGSMDRYFNEHSIALTASRAELAPAIRLSLAAAVESELPMLLERWAGLPGAQGVPWSLVWRWAGLAGMVAVAMVLAWAWHSRRLHRQIALREAAQARAEREHQATEQFLAFLAHEVRNALNSVKAGVRMMGRAEGPYVAVPADTVAALDHSTTSTLHLLNDLLDRHRMAAGRLTLVPHADTLRAVLLSVVDDMRPMAQAKGLELTAEFSSRTDVHVMLDALRVQQIVRNLLSNAIKFTPAGRVWLRCDARPAPAGRQWDLSVRVEDTGPGLSEAARSHLFQRFATSGPGDGLHAAGTGLGLALSRDLAQLMGGDLLALEPEAGSGPGARFLLTWRVDAAPVPAPADPAHHGEVRVLLVEDDPVYALLLQAALAQQACVCRVAKGATEARELLEHTPVDLVISDGHLPDHGDAVAMVRELQLLGAPQVAMLSGALEDLNLSALRSLGVQVILPKSGEVKKIVQQILHGTGLRTGPIGASHV